MLNLLFFLILYSYIFTYVFSYIFSSILTFNHTKTKLDRSRARKCLPILRKEAAMLHTRVYLILQGMCWVCKQGRGQLPLCVVYHSALPVGIKCRYKIRAPTLSHNCQVISVFSFANSHAYCGVGTHTHTHSNTPWPQCRWAPVSIYIGTCEKFDARATWKPNARAKHNLHKLGLKGHAHGQHTNTHVHTHKHAQACTVTDSRTYALKVCYKYAHYVRAKWQQRLLHTHTHTNTQRHIHWGTPTYPHNDNGSIYYCILCGHISALLHLPPFSFRYFFAPSAFEVAFHCIISLCIAN